MRQSKKLKQQKAFFIFCEWKTEKCYFEAFQELKKWNIKIKSFDFWKIWTTKKKLDACKEDIYKKIKHNKFGYGIEQLEKTKSKIFVLLDTDWIFWYTKQEIDKIKNYFKKDDLIEILFSNQDFEIFILLHLEYFSWTSKNYIKLIKKYHKNYEKGCNYKLREIHKNIIEKWLWNLKENIKKLEKTHKDTNYIKEKVPFSEIYKIIEKI